MAAPLATSAWSPVGEGPIPKSRYLDPAFLQRELDQIFAHTWLFAGYAADLDRPGAYFTFEIGDESVLVVREREGIVAFFNACMHRGRLLRDPGMGHVTSFRCPYHLWEYALDGSLAHRPEPDCFTACGSVEDLSLRRVACEVWGGLVWVNLDPRAQPLVAYLGPIADRLAAYSLEDYALVEDQTVALPCNWKVGVDAFNEAYHLRAVHSQLLQMLDESGVEVELLGRHSCIRVPFATVSPSHADQQTVNDHLKYLMRDAGLDPARFAGSARDVRVGIQQFLRQRQDLNLAALNDAQLTDNHQYYVFPNLTLNIYAMKHMLLRHRPHPTDPNQMLLDQQQYVRVPRGGKRPPRPKPETFRYGKGSLGFVTDQDTFNLVRVQRGMRSRGFTELVLGENESRIRHMHQTIDTYLATDYGK